MNDQAIMENLLLVTKGACDLYLHGSIEASTPNVRQAFTLALNDTLGMQEALYKDMTGKGWYPSEQASSQKLQSVKARFAPMA